jgi:hypothetical protein
MDLTKPLFEKFLSVDILLEEAVKFSYYPLHVGGDEGTGIGKRLEAEFRNYLDESGYHVPKAGKHGDFSDLRVDIKSMQFNGKQLWKGLKFHGYSKTGNPPEYDVLIFAYVANDTRVDFQGVYFIPSRRINWKPQSHYICTLPEESIKEFKVV